MCRCFHKLERERVRQLRERLLDPEPATGMVDRLDPQDITSACPPATAMHLETYTIPSEPEESAEGDVDAEPPSRHARVDDVPDPDDNPRARWKQSYPAEQLAGAAYPGLSRTTFDVIRDEQIINHGEVLGPFKNDAECQLAKWAKWLIQNVGHNQAEEFLKLAAVRTLLLCPCFVLKSAKYERSRAQLRNKG